MSLFGSSGIRGRVGEEITVELVTRIGAAVGLGNPSIVVGNDTRTSSDLMVEALVAGATSVGADLAVAGTVSTPTLARAAKDFRCGLMVTASHNPPEYNGVKMWNPDGSAFDPDQMNDVEGLIYQDVRSGSSWDGVGTRSLLQGAVERHMAQVLDSVGYARLKVVVDCGCGATCGITPRLIREMGCSVVTLNAQPDGHFPGRLPEPSETELGDLMGLVRATGAGLGIAHDGDGDRMVAVDERGRYVGGDVLLALFASMMDGDIAAPIDASLVLDDMVRGRVIRTRVGDMYVSDAIKRGGLSFGGEPSGTFIFPQQTYCPDGVYAAALLTSMVAETRLSEMVDALPRLPVSGPLSGSTPGSEMRSGRG